MATCLITHSLFVASVSLLYSLTDVFEDHLPNKVLELESLPEGLVLGEYKTR